MSDDDDDCCWAFFSQANSFFLCLTCGQGGASLDGGLVCPEAIPPPLFWPRLGGWPLLAHWTEDSSFSGFLHIQQHGPRSSTSWRCCPLLGIVETSYLLLCRTSSFLCSFLLELPTVILGMRCSHPNRFRRLERKNERIVCIVIPAL